MTVYNSTSNRQTNENSKNGRAYEIQSVEIETTQKREGKERERELRNGH